MMQIYKTIDILIKDAKLSPDELQTLLHLRNSSTASLQNVLELFLPANKMLPIETVDRHLEIWSKIAEIYNDT